MKKDIVLVLSDQHNGSYTSMNPEMEDITPQLRRIAEQGCWVEHAYCNSPLCVPSRMSFLSGKLPSDTRILNNDTTLNSDEVTLAHEIGLAGYRTVLVGRMHFKGLDQFHGFDERYIGDITNQYWGMSREEIKEFHGSFNSKQCQELVGEGDSPILDFDAQVFETACELLAAPHEKPLFLVIGFYSPHYPYISKEAELEVASSLDEQQLSYPYDPAYQACVQQTTLQRAQAINQAYKKMVFTIDGYVGRLYDLFQEHCDGLFVYTSDHGDQLGKRSIFGKRTLYEDSIRIPMVMSGLQLPSTKHSISLLQLHDILLSYAKEEPVALTEERIIVQSILPKQQELIWCEAVIQYPYKLVQLDQQLQLFDLTKDPQEQRDISKAYPDITANLKTSLRDKEAVAQLLAYEAQRKQIIQVLNAHGREKHMTYDSAFRIQALFEPKKEYHYRKDETLCDNQ